MGSDEPTLLADLETVSTDEPELSMETTQAFESAALIGGEKLRASGFFVNIVKARTARTFAGEKPNVLIVEDDPGTSAVIDAILKAQGMTTRVAAALGEIIRALQAKPFPDAVLLDVMLPDANGFAVLERLRRHPDLSRVPVVMLTSLTDPADVAKGLALGADGYLSKPAQPLALIAALKAVLGVGGVGAN